MALEDVYFISQVIAAFAVVASLVFVGLQIRTQTRQSRYEARQNMLMAVATLMEPLSTNAELAASYSKVTKEGWQSITAGESMQLGAFVSTTLRSIEILHRQYLDGAIEEDAWQAFWIQTDEALGTPAFTEMWAIRRHHYTEEFQKLVESREIKQYNIINIDPDVRANELSGNQDEPAASRVETHQ